MQKLQNYINGKLIEPVNCQYMDNYEPATGKVYSQVPDSDIADVELAVKAAEEAFPSWSTTPYQKRSKILHKIAELIEDKYLEKLSLAESIDIGKPVHLARTLDIPRAASNFYFFLLQL